jgi:hypothetical protein
VTVVRGGRGGGVLRSDRAAAHAGLSTADHVIWRVAVCVCVFGGGGLGQCNLIAGKALYPAAAAAVCRLTLVTYQTSWPEPSVCCPPHSCISLMHLGTW